MLFPLTFVRLKSFAIYSQEIPDPNSFKWQYVFLIYMGTGRVELEKLWEKRRLKLNFDINSKWLIEIFRFRKLWLYECHETNGVWCICNGKSENWYSDTTLDISKPWISQSLVEVRDTDIPLYLRYLHYYLFSRQLLLLFLQTFPKSKIGFLLMSAPLNWNTSQFTYVEANEPCPFDSRRIKLTLQYVVKLQK